MSSTRSERLARAMTSLQGLSVGDAFGECFFMNWDIIRNLINSGEVVGPPYDFTDDEFMARLISLRRNMAKTPWKWTDDSAMAFSVVENLSKNDEINPDELALSFGQRFDDTRGYGAAMHEILPRFANGEDWNTHAQNLFGGKGSWGNGAAMRVAPVGAYFADDLEAVVENARRSASVTHAHEEAIAGAIAVAVAAAIACNLREKALREETPSDAEENEFDGREYLNRVLDYVPESAVRDGIVFARGMIDDATVEEAAQVLGSGTEISAQDTVPFVLWCAAHELDHFDEALWLTVAGLGDRDTTCAMVGGIVACYTGIENIPDEWTQNREAFPDWFMA